ncbi:MULTISPECIES: hypothetical protein [Micrococcus]|uniref:hypothetical protein n=1 Tax=Micrococcus antarcticus TaxID=86171 RepID=UPI00326209EE
MSTDVDLQRPRPPAPRPPWWRWPERAGERVSYPPAPPSSPTGAPRRGQLLSRPSQPGLTPYWAAVLGQEWTGERIEAIQRAVREDYRPR